MGEIQENASLGELTDERSPTSQSAANLNRSPFFAITSAGAHTGNSTEERFPDISQSPGVGDYVLPELTGTDACAATFGDAGEERFPAPEQTPGAGDYEIPERKAT